MKFLLFLTLSVFLLSVIGCSQNENEPLGPEPGGIKLTVNVSAGEVYYISLNQEAEVEINDPLLESDWDIQITDLTNIKLNGGSTAPGAVYAKLVEDIAYTDLSTAPGVTYETDTQNGGYIGENWYFYDITTHTVNPLDSYYVIKATDGNFYKFMISDAVFPSRTEGELTFQVQKIQKPASYDYQSTVGIVTMYRFPLSATGNFYFNFKQAKTVDISDESSSQAWDLKSSYVTMFMNNGTSGPGNSAVKIVTDIDFDSIETVPADGYFTDDSVTSTYGIGDSWYSYDFINHILNVNPYVYIINFNNGNYAKLTFLEKEFSGQSDGYVVIKFQYIEDSDTF